MSKKKVYSKKRAVTTERTDVMDQKSSSENYDSDRKNGKFLNDTLRLIPEVLKKLYAILFSICCTTWFGFNRN